MGRYYGSEALRNPKLQKKALDYALDQLNPMMQNVGLQALDQLSTKIRPKKNYKTNRKDLDGAGIIDKALTSGIEGSPWQVDYKKGFQLLTDPTLFKGPKLSKEQMKENVKHYKELYKQAKKTVIRALIPNSSRRLVLLLDQLSRFQDLVALFIVENPQ